MKYAIEPRREMGIRTIFIMGADKSRRCKKTGHGGFS
jgi:hypothetical protein